MLHILDVILLIGFMILCCAIGFVFRNRVDSSAEEYFLAKRGLQSLPAAISITVSFLSSTAFTVYLGEIYTFGMPAYLSILGSIIVAPILTMIFQPRLYNSPHLSVYHFLEERFSKSVRYIISGLFIGSSILSLGVVGYTAAISGEVLVQIPFWISALVVGGFSTIYSTMGGLKAVIWTDVVQAIVIFSCFAVIILKICFSFQTQTEMCDLIVSGERFQLSFKDGPTHRYNAQAMVLSAVVNQLYFLSVSQPGVQRWKSVGSLSQAKRTALMTFVSFTFCSLLIYFSGLLIYAFYAKCSMDKTSLPFPDKIPLHFVSTELSPWPGLVGLCLGGMLSGALSTYSSFINSMAAVTLEDVVKTFFGSLATRHEILISKALTAFYGILGTSFIFLTARSTTVIIIDHVSRSIATSPVLGVFLLALFTKRSNSLGVILGVSVSTAFQIWYYSVTIFSGTKHVPLPSVNPLCIGNDTSENKSFQNETLSPQVSNESWILEGVKSISFVWMPVISLVLTLVIAYPFSILFRALQKKETSAVSGARDLSEQGMPLKNIDGIENRKRENENNLIT